MSTLPVDGGGDGSVVTDRELFDHATGPTPSSPEPTPAPAPDPTEGLPPSPAPGQPVRDDRGRFAPQPGQPQPQQQQRPQQPAQQQRQPEDHRVPLRELLDERERRQRIEAEHAQLVAHFQRQQQEQQPKQPPGPDNIFDGPDDYLTNRVMNPLRQEGYTMMLQVKDGISREMANQQFGEQEVTEALQELLKIRQTPHGDFIFRQVMATGHPYGALVRWHNSARAQAAIGNDPQAWLRKQQEAWFYDPKVREAMINDIRQRQGGRQQTGAQGGSPSVVQLPPSLQTVPTTSGREALGDLSSESLFNYATKS